MNEHVWRPLLIRLGAAILWAVPFGMLAPVSAQESPPPAVTEPGELDQGSAAGESGAEAAAQELASVLTRLVTSLTIFVLAIFVGFEVITKVPPTLHTPLMSGSNAISGITLVGAVLMAGFSGEGFSSVAAAVLGMLAVIMATINVVGGFLVTDRMLGMFKKK